MLRFTMYGRAECHLCQDMAATLEDLKTPLVFDYEVVDVDGDPMLAERYGLLVPVLALGDQTVCHHFLDLDALKVALEAAPACR